MSSPQYTYSRALHQPVSLTDPAIAPTSLPGTGEESAQGGQAQVTADILPDFASWKYLIEEADDYVLDVEAWHSWFTIVFTSPHRLNLRLFFTNGTSVETLAVWPSFPIIIWQSGDQTWDLDDIIEALDYNDRYLEEALAAMEQPFPALTELGIRWQDDETDEIDEAAPVVSDSFLGGSAPRLQHLDFYRVPFPGLPGLLLSATDLVHLYLWKIPHLGYFSPEAMVNCLSALTKLEILWLGFESFQPRLYQDNRCTSPMRSVLPSLTSVKFKGASKYLENLVAPIVAPLLDSLEISFFHNPVFDTPQLLQFVNRTPNVKAPVEAYVDFSDDSVSVTLPGALPRKLLLEVLCRPANSQLLSLAQVLSSSYPQVLIPAVEHLYISDTVEPQPELEDDIEDDQWLEVLRPFTAVKDLYLSREFVPRIADTFVGQGGTEVLPALQYLFLEEPRPSGAVQEAIEQFVAARQLADQPVAVSHWDREWEQEFKFEVDDLPVVDDSSMLDYLSVFDDSLGFDDSSGFDDSPVLDYSSVPDDSPVLDYLPVPDDSSVHASVPDDSSVLDD
ncbi:hypothetical protein BGY98DRAFT_989930 [Russula aff. rugulosa BPL654]|nr:hypothetical protein BGY98DRAFT_989930 [Russula aff. rugulosa BPL654]